MHDEPENNESFPTIMVGWIVIMAILIGGPIALYFCVQELMYG